MVMGVERGQLFDWWSRNALPDDLGRYHGNRGPTVRVGDAVVEVDGASASGGEMAAFLQGDDRFMRATHVALETGGSQDDLVARWRRSDR